MKITTTDAMQPGKYEQIITVAINEKYNGIELAFRFKPNATERAKLKRYGFKWHYKKMIWYATNTSDHIAVIDKLVGTKQYPDGWKMSDKQPDSSRDVIPPEFFASHSICDGDVQKALECSLPEFLAMSAEDQNSEYIKAVEKLYKAA